MVRCSLSYPYFCFSCLRRPALSLGVLQSDSSARTRSRSFRCEGGHVPLHPEAKPPKPPPKCGGSVSFHHTSPILRSQVASFSLTERRAAPPAPQPGKQPLLELLPRQPPAASIRDRATGALSPRDKCDAEAKQPGSTGAKGCTPALPQTRKQVWAWELAQGHHRQVVSWDLRLCCANTIFSWGVLSLSPAVPSALSLLLG